MYFIAHFDFVAAAELNVASGSISVEASDDFQLVRKASGVEVANSERFIDLMCNTIYGAANRSTRSSFLVAQPAVLLKAPVTKPVLLDSFIDGHFQSTCANTCDGTYTGILTMEHPGIPYNPSFPVLATPNGASHIAGPILTVPGITLACRYDLCGPGGSDQRSEL
jgi:hypothetical protein